MRERGLGGYLSYTFVGAIEGGTAMYSLIRPCSFLRPVLEGPITHQSYTYFLRLRHFCPKPRYLTSSSFGTCRLIPYPFSRISIFQYMTDPNHKTGYPKSGVGYEPLSILRVLEAKPHLPPSPPGCARECRTTDSFMV